jgi:hypothetical protein
MRAAVLLVVSTGLMAAGGASVMAASEQPVQLQRSYPAEKVVIDGFRGTLTITTAAPGAPVTVRASGKPEAMKRLDVRQDASGVLIRYEPQSNSVWWPWSMLDWSQERTDDVTMTIGAPRGTEFDMDEIAGRVSAGDLDAPLRFGGTGSGTAKFGKVTRARLEVAGSMDVTIGDTQGPLDVDIAGSGTVRTGSGSQVRLDVAGSGEFFSGALTGGFDADIAGSGDATVASVNGPVSVDIAGSGNIIIKAGRADPFKVSIAGAGDVDFGGEAVNPQVSIAGSGSVSVASMSGNLKQDIQGSGDFIVKGSAPNNETVPKPPASPTPPAAPVPPAAPSPPSPPAQ